MNKTERWFAIFYSTLLWLVQPGNSTAQSLAGTSGLLTIPTAEIVRDGELSVGFGYLPAKYAVLRDPDFGDQTYFITVGYLPFLETTWAIVRSDHIGKKWGIGDRVVSLRCKVLSEKRALPAVALGLHDPFGSQYFCASYLVVSKTLHVISPLKFHLHLGYGTDWLKATQSHFVGFFGGISLPLNKSVDLMFEYDAEKFNGGVRIVLFRHVQLLLARQNFDSFSGGVSYKFRL